MLGPLLMLEGVMRKRPLLTASAVECGRVRGKASWWGPSRRERVAGRKGFAEQLQPEHAV